MNKSIFFGACALSSAGAAIWFFIDLCLNGSNGSGFLGAILAITAIAFAKSALERVGIDPWLQ